MVLTAALMLPLQSCTHFAVEDCGQEILGQDLDKPRIRSSHWRMLLADMPAVAARFSPFAAMSTLAYLSDADCNLTDDEKKKQADDRKTLEPIVRNDRWQEERETTLGYGPCQDDVGLFYRVWTKRTQGRTAVVIGFRGTENAKDWLYGNFHWFTAFLPMDDQYKRARDRVAAIIKRFEGRYGKEAVFYTTGHSLGGGLAQHMLYSFPEKILQAVVFNPSNVTGYLEQDPANQIAACSCNQPELDNEARIYRVYDYKEVLANLRIFHKLFYSPERHVQEVRVANKQTHSMKSLALYLEAAKKGRSASSDPWYQGSGQNRYGGQPEACTQAFARAQRDSCAALVKPDAWPWERCPQGPFKP